MFWRPLAVSAVFLWLLTGTLVYYFVENCFTESTCLSDGTTVTTETCGWSFQQSFYYSVQTGLSIGFGLLSETKDLSRAYSVIHILCGSSFIAGILGYFASAALERQASRAEAHERTLARFARACHTDGYDGFTVDQLRDLFAQYPTYMSDLYFKLEKSHTKVEELMTHFKEANMQERRFLAAAALQRAREEKHMFQGKTSMKNIVDLHRESRSPMRRLVRFVTRHGRTFLVFGVWFMWIGVGTIFSCLRCDWSFITGVYFTVAAMSTAGLQAICEDPEGMNVLFVGIFSLIGVPIFGLALGTFANVLINSHIDKEVNKRMHDQITSAEIEFAQHILGHAPDSKITMSEYIEIQLLRIGAVDRDTMERLREDFNQLEPSSDGTISKDLAVKGHEHKVERHKAKDATV